MTNVDRYDPAVIEPKWQRLWDEQAFSQAEDFSKRQKAYLLFEFPYPSGDGLHVGHCRPYSAMDALARKRRMEGQNVLFPIGWDAFGLPTENYALKTGVHPRVATDKNIATFRRQMKALGLSLDWSREIDTTDPNYYRWTQWLFLQFFKKGLAYQATIPINWCPKDKIGLANEEVVGGKCERCGTEVIKKLQKQWMLKITAYADRLLKDLDTVDYPERIKTQQVNWIGKSEGAEIAFPVATKRRFVLLHGYTGFPEKWFFPWLKQELEKTGAEVIVPLLPDSEHPTEEGQVGYVLKNVPIDEHTVLFGHSLGAVVAMKVVEKLKKPVGGLVLAGGFTEAKFKDKPRPFHNTFSWDFDFGAIRKKVDHITIISSTNDYAVPIEEGRTLAKELNAPLVEIETRGGHFTGKEEPSLLDALDPRRILIGTRNPAKVKMVRDALAAIPGITAVTLDELPAIDDTELVEGDDYKENARRKAAFYYQKTGIPTIATDQILWLEKWPRDSGFITHVRKLANPTSPRASDEELAAWVEKFVDEHGESRAAFHYAIGFADARGEQDFVSVQREWLLQRTPSPKKREGYVVDRYLRDLKTNEYRVEMADPTALNRFREFIVGEFAEKALERTAIRVFTTRPDTIFGATYVVLAPEHPLVSAVTTPEQKKQVDAYVKKAAAKSDLERTDLAKEKTGVFTGAYALNPLNNEKIPIWVADYVLLTYGTGAIMAVPAHDARDYDFAKKFKLSVQRVVEPKFIARPDGESAVKPGEPFVKRNAICAIIRNPKTDKYLCIRWKTVHMHGLVTGGVEDGEDLVEAGKREIREETGYRNVRLVRDPQFALHSLFYHRVKQQNRWARFQYLFFELKNEEQDPVSETESSLHEVRWLSDNELKNFFSVIEGEYVIQLIQNPDHIHTGEGVLHNSGVFDGLDSAVARRKIIEEIEKRGQGKAAVQYKLRDWVFSRQHYWGEPIPIIHCPEHGAVPVPEDQLPVELPHVEKYQPTGTGESPLAAVKDWVQTKCPTCGQTAKRETDTMPNWAGSSWYFLRYTDPKNPAAFADPKHLKYWLPVDLYEGGMEHTTLHLLYSRFWHKFLYDQKLVPTVEPYAKRRSHGIVLAEDGRKMSKSFGNVINPDAVIEQYGADTLRIYEMFMGPFEDAIPWSTKGIIGVRRFLGKVWRLQEKTQSDTASPELSRLLHQTIKKVGDDLEAFKFNTAVSALMIFVNALEYNPTLHVPTYETFLKLLMPFAPHQASEILDRLKHNPQQVTWPRVDPRFAQSKTITLVVQIAGRRRDAFEVPRGTGESDATAQTLDRPLVKKYLVGKPKRVIFVPDRLINLIP